ncbi:MAG: hypothetical protein ACRC6M_17935 [Microcystaceae cyanobacterium]
MLSSSKNNAITVRPQPPISPRILAEEKFKQERLHDIQLLLQDLFVREESTIRLILEYLYDIGAINIINKKFPFPPLNIFLKSIVGIPKPLAKKLLLRWFKQKCPGILAEWLYNKVR